MAKVTLLAYTPEPEKLVAAAAKLCYSSSSPQTLMDGLTPEKTESFLEMLQTIGHESPVEHVSFTFGIEGVSRSLLAQITRHRIASYSVQSQRYVREKDFQYVTPPEIAAIPEALELYEQTMAQIGESYDKAEKMAIEDARFVLPNACDTQMVVTMNARSLLNFFRHRCCNRAQWEIREVAYQMLSLVYEVAPTLFQNAGAPCIRGNCPEGKMSCGHPDAVRAYDAMRKGKATR